VFRQLGSHRDHQKLLAAAQRTAAGATPRPHPITGQLLVEGAAVKGERSESAGHGAQRSAVDGRDGDQYSEPGDAETPTTDQRKPVPTAHERKMIMEDRKSRAVPVVLLSVPEAATSLGLSKTMLYELIRSNRLRTVKQGRRRLVPVAALAEYVAALELSYRGLYRS
jgi:excisionase family DNA binding protein